jgi:hypothetical protein
MAGDARCDDIGIVGRAGGGESIRALNPGLDQHLPIEAHPPDGTAFKFWTKAGQGSRIAVNDHNLVTILYHEPANLLAYPATTHYDDFHGALPPVNVSLSSLCILRTIPFRIQSRLYNTNGYKANPIQK